MGAGGGWSIPRQPGGIEYPGAGIPLPRVCEGARTEPKEVGPGRAPIVAPERAVGKVCLLPTCHPARAVHQAAGLNRAAAATTALAMAASHCASALICPINATIRPFLAADGISAEQVDTRHEARRKSVIIQIVLWSRAYAPGLWWPSDHPAGAQVGGQLLTQRTAGLHEQGAVDALVGHLHLRVVWMADLEPAGDLLRRPAPATSDAAASPPRSHATPGWPPACTPWAASPGPRRDGPRGARDTPPGHRSRPLRG